MHMHNKDLHKYPNMIQYSHEILEEVCTYEYNYQGLSKPTVTQLRQGYCWEKGLRQHRYNNFRTRI